MEYYAIILAAGNSTRYNKKTPKQFELLAGKPLIYHSLDKFYQFNSSIKSIVVVPELFYSLWQNQCLEYNINIPHLTVIGGQTRFHSVQNGLKACEKHTSGSLVAIHDAARPLFSIKLVEKGFELAKIHRSAIPVIPITDSIRKITDESNEHLPRNQFFLVQTPQFFDLNLISYCYNTQYNSNFTDDSSVLQYMGISIHTFYGDYYNIKITYSLDLKIAETILKYINK